MMHIQPINKIHQPSVKGLYFTKAPNIIFNRNPKVNFITLGIVSKSDLGYRYIEDIGIPQEIKDKFHFIKFTRELAKETDAFIFFKELPKNHPCNFTDTFFSCAKIMWLNHRTGTEQCRTVSGNSSTSCEEATQKMFENLVDNDFHEFRIQ